MMSSSCFCLSWIICRLCPGSHLAASSLQHHGETLPPTCAPWRPQHAPPATYTHTHTHTHSHTYACTNTHMRLLIDTRTTNHCTRVWLHYCSLDRGRSAPPRVCVFVCERDGRWSKVWLSSPPWQSSSLSLPSCHKEDVETLPSSSLLLMKPWIHISLAYYYFFFL